MGNVYILRLACMHKNIYSKPLYETSDLPNIYKSNVKKAKTVIYKYRPWI